MIRTTIGLILTSLVVSGLTGLKMGDRDDLSLKMGEREVALKMGERDDLSLKLGERDVGIKMGDGDQLC